MQLSTVTGFLKAPDLLIGKRGLQAALGQVSQRALRLLAADHASIRLCDDDDPRLHVAARAGVGLQNEPPPFFIGQGLMGWVAERGELARVSDCDSDPRFQAKRGRGYPVGSILSVPLCTSGRVLGVLSLSSPRRGAFRHQDEELGLLLAHCAEQAVQLESLGQLVITDVHTKAFNSGYLMPRLNEEMQRAQRGGAALSVMLLDLDDFKLVNDSFGHAVGDHVLRTFVQTVRGCIRGVDIIVRRGGDEFVLIMPATGEQAARGVAERIRRQLMRQEHCAGEQVTFAQTASIGVATWDGSESAAQLETRADAAMYRAKRAGRNRVAAARRRRGPAPIGRQLDLWDSGAAR